MAAATESTPWIAMYHSVGDCSEDPYRVTVTPDRLDHQLSWLRRRGLRGVSVSALLAAPSREGLVGLTFDDGYADFLDHALAGPHAPRLRRHPLRAARQTRRRQRLGPARPAQALLTADGIREAADAGVEIGSHGMTHLDLTRADDITLKSEVVESRATLEELTGAPVSGFCYPYGTLDQRAVDTVRDAGYTYACAIDPGGINGPLALPRVHIGQHDTAVRLYLKYRLHRLRRRPVEGI